MSGGELHVHGSVQTWAGAEMQGGLIHVHGHAGDLVGAAYRGSSRGMLGGTILVDGNAGHEVGMAMRRGMIAVGGAAGDLLGLQLLAGTILVMGQCGLRPGAGMRRGTLGIFGPDPPPLLPSFRYACTGRPPILRLLCRELRGQGFAVDEALLHATCDLFHGDFLNGGRGELMVRQAGGTP
jgi:formylmethanofuran dehydrogenase subunit C